MILMHHIVMDGWSMGKIWGEIMALYKAITAGDVPLLPELPLQYSDFAAWERKHLKEGNTAEHTKLVEYWQKQLQYATPVVQLPLDYPRPMSVKGGRPSAITGVFLDVV